ncbi:hypothetical protein [Streptantibioticus ferralitis]|uniref:Uncharacterized protein n=1 Tax=Streptantibioticus ferralitis TaxID=236510 RepID=A0ABT5Z262_9ACTN|nr:hypothetical protein [Streptantibioticus ferralitis]MDF2257747.1 hypothetical protein [Streptantibioticus ferralitis]
MFIVVVGVLLDDEPQVTFAGDEDPVGGFAAARADPALNDPGTPGRTGTTRAPTAVKTASKPSVKYPALSRIRYRMPAVRVSSRLIRRLRACWAAHWAVTLRVTPAMCTLCRSKIRFVL